jgi:WD40 repeat protein
MITGGIFKHLWLLRTDSLGDTLWTRTYGEEDGQEGRSLALTPDGGCIITGYNGEALWLLKTDSLGDTLWTRIYEYGDAYSEKGHCVQPTSDGGYIITGVANYMLFRGNGDLWLLKTDSLGDILWSRIYGAGDIDEGKSVRETPDGGYIITGVKGYAMERGGALWLLKTDSLGDTLWTRIIGNTPDARGDCVQLTSDGGYIITGFSTYGSKDIVVIKTDSLGYVAVEEEPTTDGQVNWEVISSIGSQITLQYTDSPQGFVADIFDVTGRKVGELHNTESSGVVYWGQGQPTGVYFIVPQASDLIARKVVLVR